MDTMLGFAGEGGREGVKVMCGKICMPKDEFPARSNSPGVLSESASFLTVHLG